jgi:hypothetical protein
MEKFQITGGSTADMENTSCRTCQRIKIEKSVSYNGLDVQSNVVDRYMGVALNISQNGLQLETDNMINTEYILLMFFDYQSNYIATRGKVVYSDPVESGKYRTGIQLTGVNGNNRKFVKRLIQSYHYQKKVPIFIS